MKRWCRISLGGLALIVLAGMAQFADAKNKDKKAPVGSGNPSAEAIFKYLDKDGDGKLTATEFKDTKTGDAAKDAAAQFKQWDKDGDDSLSTAEHKTGMDSLPKPGKQPKPAAKKKKK